MRKLAGTITETSNDDAVKVIILKSGGDRTFCAGASFDELMSIDDFEKGKEFFMGFAHVINACRKSPKPIIGRVQGKAVGGGVGVASTVDYCFATKFASLRLSELAIGIGPFVVGPAVERKVGKSAMSQMALQPDIWYSADWGKENGIYSEVFDTTEEMDTRIQILSQKLAVYNPQALTELKKTFWVGTDDWDNLLEERAGISGRLVLSEFTKQAISDFKKR